MHINNFGFQTRGFKPAGHSPPCTTPYQYYSTKKTILYFPTSQVRVVRFYHSCSSPPPLPPPCQSSSPTSSPILIAKLLANPPRQLLIAVGTAGPQLPASDRSGHPWTSTASVSSQWASLDLNCQRRIPVGTTGPQLPASDLSGHPWTSTTRSYHKTLSQNIITKHLHKASSQYASSQNITTDHLHKSLSQTIFTKHHHNKSSQSIITNHYLIFTKHHRNTLSHKTLS